MKNALKTVKIVVIATIIGFIFNTCDQIAVNPIIIPPGTPPISINKFEAKQSLYTGNEKIRYSFSYDGYDFIYIHLGELAYLPLYYEDAQYFGTTAEWTYEFSTATASTKTIRETVSRSRQEVLSIVDQYTKSTTNTQKIGVEISEKYNMQATASAKYAGISASVQAGYELGVKATAEASWSQYISNSLTYGFQETTSLTDTIECVTTFTDEKRTTNTWPLSKAKGDKEGWYRYTLFSASDVYLYVIKDTKGVIYYEFIEHIKPNAFGWMLDYSDTISFEKSDNTGFNFDISILDSLPPAGINFYTVIFDKNNKDPDSIDAYPQTSTVISLESNIGSLPQSPKRLGWNFVGWNTAADGSGIAF